MEEFKNGKISEFNIYSEEVQEVLTTPPNSLYFTGNTIIAVVLLSLLFLTWLIRFPDVIVTTAFITSEQAPIKLVAQTNGDLTQLLVADGDLVEQDAIMAIITSNEGFEDMLALKTILEEVKKNIEENKSYPTTFPADLKIGELSASYATLKSLCHKLYTVIDEFPILREEEKLQNQLKDIEEMIKLLEEEREYIIKQFVLIEQNHKRQTQLYSEGLISKLDLEESEYEVNTHASEKSKLEYRIQDLKLSANNIRRQEESLKTTELRSTSDIKLEIHALVEQLLAQIKIWEYQHVIKAPFTGKCSFVSFLEQNQFIATNQEIFYLSPNSDKFEVRGTLPIEKSGLIESGQKVIIKLRPYPFKEYGTIAARITKVSYVPNEEGYIYFARLENGLTTNYDKTIDFKPLLQGDAEIIVEEARLIERIFKEVRNIFKN